MPGLLKSMSNAILAPNKRAPTSSHLLESGNGEAAAGGVAAADAVAHGNNGLMLFMANEYQFAIIKYVMKTLSIHSRKCS
jgi:hypothetical protein